MVSDGEESKELFDEVIADRDIHNIPKDFAGLDRVVDMSKLCCLKICGVGLTSVPGSLCLLTNLSTIELVDNKLTDLPEELCQLPVIRFSVAGNKLQTLPACFYLGLRYVRELDISRNAINDLMTPPSCASMLRSLDFSDNRVLQLPEWLSTSCGALWSLSAARNGSLRGVSGGAPLRTPLRYLDLTACSVNELGFLAVMQNLVSLHVGNDVKTCAQTGNCFWDFPEAILQFADSLTELSMRGTYLSQLPPSIGLLHSLTLLDLRDCEMHTLPTEVGQLVNLHSLLLSNNHLVSLPNSVADLRSLRDLRVDGNQMELLPSTLSQLSGLVLLDLYDNRLDQWESDWPDSLQALDLECNYCPAKSSERYEVLRNCLRQRLNANYRLVGTKPGETHLDDDESDDSYHKKYDDSLSESSESPEMPQSPESQSRPESDWGSNSESDTDDEWTPPENCVIGSLHRVKMVWPPPLFAPKTFVNLNHEVSAGQFTELTEN